MHGLMHAQLQKFVLARHGRQAWLGLLQETGLGARAYLTSQQYPNEEMLALVTAASRATGTPMNALLEQFGEFIVPDLLRMYRPMLRPDWRTLDLLEHTETTIHNVVRLRNPGAAPAHLRCKRLGPDLIHLSYDSARKMCAFARGIIRGIAREFAESIEIQETSCMHRGSPSCEMGVKRTAAARVVRPA